MYKRRNRRSGRYFDSQTSINSTDDVIILPDKPAEIISLLDSEDETENNNKRKRGPKYHSEQSPKRKHTRFDVSPEAGPSTAAKLRYPQTDAFTPYFIDTKKEDDTPVIQIPLYKPNNDSIICLDDTLAPAPLLEQSSPSSLTKYESVLNDSVVIVMDESHVEDHQRNETLEEGEIRADDSFIPLDSGPAVSIKLLFLRQDLKINFSPNQKSPKKNDKKKPNKDEKRLIVIDGNNVAMQHGSNKAFSVQGIVIAIKHFEDLGHEVKAIIPQFRMKLHKSTSQVLLEKLQDEGKVLLTPCKNLPGKMSSSYDDR